MTLDETFSRTGYPLRARAEAKFSEKDITVKISAFYQTPLVDESSQNNGGSISIYAAGKEILAMAITSNRLVGSAEHDNQYYYFENGEYSPVSERKAEQKTKKTLHGFEVPNPEELTWAQFQRHPSGPDANRGFCFEYWTTELSFDILR